MKKTGKALLAVAACMMCAVAAAQDGSSVDFDKSILLPFPTSAAFKRYATPQPALSTGTVNVPVELFHLKYRDLDIPFTLQYSTQGVKVYDDSYPNGLGWTLTPGLRITRAIMGLPDEVFPRHQYNESTDHDRFDILYPASVPYDRNHSLKVIEGGDSLIDMQHDIFTVYLPGESQTFIIERDGGGFSVEGNGCNNLKITTDRKLSHFIVVDAKGVIYDFSRLIKEYRGQPDNVTAWMLKEATLPDGSKVKFDWAAYNHSMPGEFGCGMLIDEIKYAPPRNIAEDFRPGYSNPERTGNIPSHSSSDDMMHLTGVSFPSGSIALEYETTGGGTTQINRGTNPLLHAFTVLNNLGDTVKSAVMRYEKMNERQALLESVSLSGEGTYTFDYRKVPIAYDQRYAQDWWGFYNGKTGNTARAPRIKVKTSDSPALAGWYLQVGEADRSVDTLLMQANMLTAVHFPTGGFCKFEYEPHRWDMSTLKRENRFHNSAQDDISETIMRGGGLRVHRILLYESDTAEPAVTEYRYGENENGLAVCVDMPLPHTFLNERIIYFNYLSELGFMFTCRYRELLVNPESDYMRYHLNESPIWYTTVTEYKAGGKTVYTFKKHIMGNNIVPDCGGGVPGHLRMTSSKGALLAQRDEFQLTEAGYKQLNSVRYSYKIQQGPMRMDCATQLKQGTYTSNGLSPLLAKLISGSRQSSNTFRGTPIIEAQPYSLEFHTEQLESVTTIEYTANGPLETKKKYTYCAGLELIAEETTSRNGKALATTCYSYPPSPPADMAHGEQAALMRELAIKNKIADPCKTQIFHDGTSTSWTTRYVKHGGLVLPLSKNFSRNGNTRELYTLGYDSRGNVASAVVPGGLACKAYMWGYGYEYPVVAVNGMTRQQVDAALGPSATAAIETHTRAAALSAAHSTLSAAGALVQAFEVKPLIGIFSHISPNRNTSRFNYDGSARLVAVHDLNGDIVSRYAYSTATLGAGQDAFLPPAWTSSSCNHTSERTMLDQGGRTWIDKIIYYDGLGRERESVVLGDASVPNLASLTECDLWGRPVRKWNATPVQDDGFVPVASFTQAATTFYGDEVPYIEYRRLMSHVDSIAEIKPQGANWAGRNGVLQSTCVNDGTPMLRCALFTVGSSGALLANGYMPDGMLRVDMRTSEDGERTLGFTDGQGLTVLTRVAGPDGTTADTYYVYDSYNQLRYVIPPMAAVQLAGKDGTWTSTSDVISCYAYCYNYDDFGRCTSKKIPGCEPVLMRYDRADRLVLVQDGNMRKTGLWKVTLYDRFSRPAVSFMAKLADPDAFASTVGNVEPDASAAAMAGYRVDTSLLEKCRLLTVNYYDNYSFIGTLPAGMQEDFAWKPVEGCTRRGDCATGLLTGQRVFILGDTASTVTAMYYDEKGRVVQTVASNHKGGIDRYSLSLSFTGKPLTSKAEHSTSTHADVVCSHYDYDSRDRLTATAVSHDGAAFSTLYKMEYDGAGRMTRNIIGSDAATAVIGYNVRNWVTSINCGPAFSQRLFYEDPQGSVSPRYGGDVSQMTWTQKEHPDSLAGIAQQYSYTYDGLGRLTAAVYAGAGERDYSASYSYDLNGNMTAIARNGLSSVVSASDCGTVMEWGEIDNVGLSYDGNRLVKADDAALPLSYAGAMDFKDKADRPTEYEYDACGNMTRDLNKGIAGIDYNELNLPSEVRFADGHVTRYTYDAAGRKLRVEYLLNTLAALDPVIGPPGVITRVQSAVPSAQAGGTEKTNVPAYATLLVRDYCGDHVYCNGTLERVLNDAGYRDSTGYHYYVKDYQGNVRAVVADDGTLEEVNSYYPYGMLHGPSAIAAGVQPCKYTGKELDRQAGLDFYDFEARHMDPALGRTTTQDPMAEKYSGLSPYLWCAGNPVRYTDPTGETLNMQQPIEMDKICNTDYVKNIVEDLKLITGLSLYISDDKLIYSKDSSGNPIYEGGSKTARDLLINIIDGKEVEVFVLNRNSTAPSGGSQIGLSATQINNFIKNSHNLDSRTLGWGMVFLHELYHTGAGGSLSDVSDNYGTGSVVDNMNIIREELNATGLNFGQRMNYSAIVLTEYDNGCGYLPFDQNALCAIQLGVPPYRTSKYIKIRNFQRNRGL